MNIQHFIENVICFWLRWHWECCISPQKEQQQKVHNKNKLHMSRLLTWMETAAINVSHFATCLQVFFLMLWIFIMPLFFFVGKHSKQPHRFWNDLTYTVIIITGHDSYLLLITFDISSHQFTHIRKTQSRRCIQWHNAKEGDKQNQEKLRSTNACASHLTMCCDEFVCHS